MKSKIENRIIAQTEEENNSFQAMVIGFTGRGKSLSSLSLLKSLDPDFTVDRVVFTPEDFLDLVNSDLKPGSAILCDEIGSWLSARDWYSLQNKLMSIILETYRYKRLIVFWTVPNIRMVDVNLRDLCHATIETVAIDRKNSLCEAKFKYRQVNPVSGKSYDKFPVIRREDGTPITITRIYIKRPPIDIEKAYELKKMRHLKKVYKEIYKTLKKMKGPEKKKGNKKELIIRDLRKGFTPTQIAKKRKTTPAYVREIRAATIGKEF